MIRLPAPVLAVALACAATSAALTTSPPAAERPRPSLCPDDLPEGVHLPPQPGCAGRDRPAAGGRRDGFVDLGNGTTVRIGGRAAAEFGARR
ncbi:hypothetical protein [Methylobacterium aerolatum]|uniref:Porin n=1 Tax=Methylobacterium aerolatum TaxID=418708 RepID=A0ABU0HWV3_9HYPH|nr:hypothetical protein [Methylobacterium aerolatum]MDQ0446805.1 hypothetical protein [Methylobacterium aerolatum]GJD33771.1 hypothetical protein FMGBMHLM_0664 [Methylobacterium aerolatum]